MQPRRPRLLIGLALAVILLLLWPAWVGFYTDWLWYQEVGYQTVFSTVLATKLVLGVAVGSLAAVLLWLNFKLGLRLSKSLPPVQRFLHLEDRVVPAPDLSQVAARFALPGSLAIGAFIGARGWDAWDVLLQYRAQVPFGATDPIFGRDLAFYFFSLPLLEFGSQLALLVVVVGLAGAALLYFSRNAIRISERELTLERGPRTHLLGIAAALFLVLAWRTYLQMPNLLYSRRGPVAGASYTDINAMLPVLKVEVAVAVLVAVLAAASAFRAKSGLLYAGLGLYLLVLAGGGWLYPSVVQRFSVAPNELAKETEYIVHNIAATRQAFALDRVEERELSADASLMRADIDENRRTINNIPLWDHQPLLDTFAQIQEIRPYYKFRAVDNDRYLINGEMQQIMLSARELSSAHLPNRNWINERLTFTHGFGLTLGPVNRVTPEGLPVLFIKDLPPVTSAPALNITQPEIYFGEISSDPVYVKTKTKEFSYPSGDQNVFASYAGEGGVSIGSTWRQLIFATRFGDMKLLLSEDMTPESRVLYHRNIQDRLTKVAPFLRFDRDPYQVISEGRLYWICDAYTISDRYPYSQPVSVSWGNLNYIRNSVKAVVDAYHGLVRLYVADPDDPLIKVYDRIFPGVMRPLEEMPRDLRAHLRYPEDIFRIQTAVYSTYHMSQPQVFYNKEDQWEIASVSGSQDKPQMMEPYYIIMKLPEEQSEEFLLMLPFTPRGKDNLSAWMVARADGENYGRLLTYRFPKQKLVYGPKQIMARINQDAEISRQLSLWNQRGSQVILGTLLVIPIKESLIYIQPLYLRAESGKIPELKRVIAVAENRIAMEETLEASLGRVFGSGPSPELTPMDETLAKVTPPGEAAPKAPPAADAANLAAQARQHYERAMQAQREGDWARYGEEIKRLGAVLEQMARQK
jgi:uncharacterized membrane protein (UPF0182 family)